jgi:hypothetical protein
MAGFSGANLLFMRAFAETWTETPIVSQPVRQLEGCSVAPPIGQKGSGKSPTACQAIAQVTTTIVNQPGKWLEIGNLVYPCFGIRFAPLSEA